MSEQTTATQWTHVAIAMNEWMRRYIEEPERFEAEVTTVRRFLAEEVAGEEPSYGEIAAAYLAGIVAEKRRGVA